MEPYANVQEIVPTRTSCYILQKVQPAELTTNRDTNDESFVHSTNAQQACGLLPDTQKLDSNIQLMRKYVVATFVYLKIVPVTIHYEIHRVHAIDNCLKKCIRQDLIAQLQTHIIECAT